MQAPPPFFPLASIPIATAPLYRNPTHEAHISVPPIRRHRNENMGAQDGGGNEGDSRRRQLRTFLSWPHIRLPLWTPCTCGKHAPPPFFPHYCGNDRPRSRLFCPGVKGMRASGWVVYSRARYEIYKKRNNN